MSFAPALSQGRPAYRLHRAGVEYLLVDDGGRVRLMADGQGLRLAGDDAAGLEALAVACEFLDASMVRTSLGSISVAVDGEDLLLAVERDEAAVGTGMLRIPYAVADELVGLLRDCAQGRIFVGRPECLLAPDSVRALSSSLFAPRGVAC